MMMMPRPSSSAQDGHESMDERDTVLPYKTIICIRDIGIFIPL